jgi:hypothetical protein
MRDTIRRPRILPNFLIVALVAAFVALLSVGPIPFSVRGAAAILAAGATFGIFAAAAVYLFRDLSGAAFYPAVAVAGAVGGCAWWLIVRPSSSVLSAAVIGAAITLLAAIFEGRAAQS